MAIRCHLFASLLLATSAAWSQLPEPDGGGIERGVLPKEWLKGGPKCMEAQEWQIHEYNENFYILRQSGCTDYEKPFVYLIFGKERALLLDTGSRNGNLAPTLQRVVHNWLLRNQRIGIPLVVTHSHIHGDHIAGDAGIQALQDPTMPITLVAATVAANKAFFRVTAWPDDIGSVDLGDRIVDMIPIPGHSETSIALYDRNTAVLLTGDSLYPGRLYIKDLEEFEKSTERLIRFTDDKPVAHILGCHIEQTRTPFLDYPVGTIYQPDEHELSLSRGTLLELRDALRSLGGQPRRVAFRDFSLWPVRSSEQGMVPKTAELFRKTQDEQNKNKWNQPK
jgi:hydroxyacylglutathione hydrolase